MLNSDVPVKATKNVGSGVVTVRKTTNKNEIIVVSVLQDRTKCLTFRRLMVVNVVMS